MKRRFRKVCASWRFSSPVRLLGDRDGLIWCQRRPILSSLTSLSLFATPFVLRFSYDTRPFSYAFPTNYSLCWVTYLNYQSFSFFFNTFGLFYKTLEQKEDLGWNNSETNYNITTLSVALKWTYSVHFGEDPDKNELKLTIVYRTIVSSNLL